MKRILTIFLVGVFAISLTNFAGFALAESNQPTQLAAAMATPEPMAPMATPAPTKKPTTKKKHHKHHKHAAPAATPAPESTKAPE